MPDLMNQSAAMERSPAEMSDPFAPGNGSEADWGEADFFADPFKDAFGFPAEDGAAKDAAPPSDNSFFGSAFPATASDDPPSPYVPMHSEGWGTGSGAVLPVDFTPRNSNSSGTGAGPMTPISPPRTGGNLDALSELDGPGGRAGIDPRAHGDDALSLGSMSQLTNPTFVTSAQATHATREGGVDADGEGDAGEGEVEEDAGSAGSLKENRQQYRNIAAKYKMRKMGKLPPSYGGEGNRRGASTTTAAKKDAPPGASGQDDPPLTLGSLDTFDTASDDGAGDGDRPERVPPSRSRSPAGGRFASSRILSKYNQRRAAAGGGSVSGNSVSGASAGSGGRRSPARPSPAKPSSASVSERSAKASAPVQSARRPVPQVRDPPASPVRRRRGGGTSGGATRQPAPSSPTKASKSGTMDPYYGGRRRESPSVVDNPNYYNVSNFFPLQLSIIFARK